MERSSLIKFGVVGLLVALYLGARFAQEPPPPVDPNAPQNAAPTPAPTPRKPLTTVKELKKEDLKVGTGKVAKTGDKVTVHYRGTLTDGTEFDSTAKSGKPYEFQLGAGRVIKGWDLGVVGMKENGMRRLTIPANLAYGATGSPPVIPANATLIFEIGLMKVG